MLNLHDLRKKDMKALRKESDELEKQIALEVFNIESRRSTKTAQLRAMKKDFARIATVVNELTIINRMNHEKEND